MNSEGGRLRRSTALRCSARAPGVAVRRSAGRGHRGQSHSASGQIVCPLRCIDIVACSARQQWRLRMRTRACGQWAQQRCRVGWPAPHEAADPTAPAQLASEPSSQTSASRASVYCVDNLMEWVKEWNLPIGPLLLALCQVAMIVMSSLIATGSSVTSQRLHRELQRTIKTCDPVSLVIEQLLNYADSPVMQHSRRQVGKVADSEWDAAFLIMLQIDSSGEGPVAKRMTQSWFHAQMTAIHRANKTAEFTAAQVKAHQNFLLTQCALSPVEQANFQAKWKVKQDVLDARLKIMSEDAHCAYAKKLASWKQQAHEAKQSRLRAAANASNSSQQPPNQIDFYLTNRNAGQAGHAGESNCDDRVGISDEYSELEEDDDVGDEQECLPAGCKRSRSRDSKPIGADKANQRPRLA